MSCPAIPEPVFFSRPVFFPGRVFFICTRSFIAGLAFLRVVFFGRVFYRPQHDYCLRSKQDRQFLSLNEVL